MEKPIIVDEEDIVNYYRFTNGLYFKAVHRVLVIKDISLCGKTERKTLHSHYESNLPCADFVTMLYCIREGQFYPPKRIAHYFERKS